MSFAVVRLPTAADVEVAAVGPSGATAPVPEPPRIEIVRGTSGQRPYWGVRGPVQRTGSLRVLKSEDGVEWSPIGLIPESDPAGMLPMAEPSRPVALFRFAERLGPRLLFQDFTGAAGTAPGSLPDPVVGNPWRIRGLAWTGVSLAQVTNGVADDPNPVRQVTYLCQQFTTRPRLMEMTGEWRPYRADGVVDSSFVMALSTAAEGLPWYRRCVHIRFHRNAVAVDTSDNAPIVVNRWLVRNSPLLELGKVHHFAAELEGERLVLYVDGQVVLQARHPDFDRLAGPAVFWELYSDSGVRRNTAVIRTLDATAPLP